jgi:hypothetical protein
MYMAAKSLIFYSLHNDYEPPIHNLIIRQIMEHFFVECSYAKDLFSKIKKMVKKRKYKFT